MKFRPFHHEQGYRYPLTFDSGEVMSVDLYVLIATHVSDEQLHTAHLDTEWGGLKFNDGEVDIEPIILYRFARQEREREESTPLPIVNVRDAQIPLWRKSTAPCTP